VGVGGDGARTRAWRKFAPFIAAPSIAIASAQMSGQPARPRILGIAEAAIQVTSLAEARRFYGELLGLPASQPGGTTTGLIFTINDRQRLIVRGGLPADQDERLLHVAYEISELEAVRAYLNAQSIKTSEPATDPYGAGRAFDAIDPDGHRVRFIQRDQKRASDVSAPTAADRHLSRRLLHTGLTVRDAAAADRFYKDALGFSEIWRGGRTDDVTSWINMRVPDGTDYLEYMLIAGPADRKQLGTLHHVALLVPDIQEALERVRARADARNAQATPQIGRNRRWQLNLYDPDGTRVELMEPWTAR
jgi:catechol 2,3-dioxygenase-like lactoylglutathione lyase family enzyme